MDRFAVREFDNDGWARIRTRKLKYGAAVVVDRMKTGRSLSGADKNYLAAGLKLR
jgi:hypothetical protein